LDTKVAALIKVAIRFDLLHFYSDALAFLSQKFTKNCFIVPYGIGYSEQCT